VKVLRPNCSRVAIIGVLICRSHPAFSLQIIFHNQKQKTAKKKKYDRTAKLRPGTPFAKVARALPAQSLNVLADTIMDIPELVALIRPAFLAILNAEFKHISEEDFLSKFGRDRLKDVQGFDHIELLRELADVAPWAYDVLFTLAGGFTETKMAGVVTAAGLLLRQRNRKLGFIALMIDTILKAGGNNKLVFVRLSKLVPSHPPNSHPHKPQTRDPTPSVHTHPYRILGHTVSHSSASSPCSG
jgi:hypothetical protein